MSRPTTETGDGPCTFCVVVAGPAHARVLVLEPERETGDTAASELVEVAEITNPMVRARNVAVLSAHRRDIERHFAAEIAEEAAAVWSCYPPCELIVAANPAMLAVLRPAIQARTGGPIHPIGIHELARDLTRLTGPQLHGELAGAGLIPARGAAAGRNGVACQR